jgi:CDP-diglyceride synthetase
LVLTPSVFSHQKGFARMVFIWQSLFFIVVLQKIKFVLMKYIMYLFALLLSASAIWFIYIWFKSEPNNKEPLPALLTTIASCITLFITWRYENTSNPEGSNKTFFRTNSAIVKGKNIIVKQGNKSQTSFEKNESKAEGEDISIEQG